jgi:hypothetical protein
MPDDRVRVPTIAAAAGDLAPGTPYALCVLKPSREFTIDREDLAAGLDTLTGRALRSMPEGEYAVVAGRAGEPPQLSIGSASPFRRSTVVADVPVEIRMESWLASDTIRRMGFGHVIARRRHTMIVERGVNLVAFDDRGVPTSTVYAASLFGGQRRYFVDLSRDILDP